LGEVDEGVDEGVDDKFDGEFFDDEGAGIGTPLGDRQIQPELES